MVWFPTMLDPMFQIICPVTLFKFSGLKVLLEKVPPEAKPVNTLACSSDMQYAVSA